MLSHPRQNPRGCCWQPAAPSTSALLCSQDPGPRLACPLPCAQGHPQQCRASTHGAELLSVPDPE